MQTAVMACMLLSAHETVITKRVQYDLHAPVPVMLPVAVIAQGYFAQSIESFAACQSGTDVICQTLHMKQYQICLDSGSCRQLASVKLLNVQRVLCLTDNNKLIYHVTRALTKVADAALLKMPCFSPNHMCHCCQTEMQVACC